MKSTLLLDQADWDLTIDAFDNIALATEPYSILQDVASACRLFAQELWYDTTKGIPYFEEILGEFMPLSAIKLYMVNAAKSVPSVESAEVFITSIEGRSIGGQVQVVINDELLVVDF